MPGAKHPENTRTPKHKNTKTPYKALPSQHEASLHMDIDLAICYRPQPAGRGAAFAYVAGSLPAAPVRNAGIVVWRFFERPLPQPATSASMRRTCTIAAALFAWRTGRIHSSLSTSGCFSTLLGKCKIRCRVTGRWLPVAHRQLWIGPFPPTNSVMRARSGSFQHFQGNFLCCSKTDGTVLSVSFCDTCYATSFIICFKK